MTVAEKIAARAYWTVRIRPSDFEARRVPYADLEPIISRCSVNIRGWDVPHIDVNDPIERHADYIEQSCDWEHHVEVWRFFQSGQLLLRKGMRLAWRDQSDWFDDSRIPDLDVVGVSDTVGHYFEVYELAARLAVTKAGSESMVVETAARNIGGHRLFIDSAGRVPLSIDYVTNAPTFETKIEVGREDLVTNANEFAIDAAEEFMSRFGFDVSREVLASLRDEFR